MEKILQHLYDEFDRLQGTFVLTSHTRPMRLVAIGETDFDYYYILYDGKKFRWEPVLTGIMELKGYLKDVDYDELERLAELNHIDRFIDANPENEYYTSLDEFKRELTKDFVKFDKLLTKIGRAHV